MRSNWKILKSITRHTMLHEDLRHIYRAFPKGAHPMAMLSGMVNALSTFYPDFGATIRRVDLAIWRLMGKMPTIAGWAFKKISDSRLFILTTISVTARIS